jgi:hypothetical protein
MYKQTVYLRHEVEGARTASASIFLVRGAQVEGKSCIVIGGVAKLWAR